MPAQANLRAAYASFAELEGACQEWCAQVNGRVHRESAAIPADRLAIEREHLHTLPAGPYVLALGEERTVDDDQTIRFGSVRYSTPPGHVGSRVWCRVAGGELVITAATTGGLAEIARHRLSVPGSPRICDEHYPYHPGGNARQPGRGRAPVADRGRRVRRAADPHQDGPRGLWGSRTRPPFLTLASMRPARIR